jgi:hypothetical protein
MMVVIWLFVVAAEFCMEGLFFSGFSYSNAILSEHSAVIAKVLFSTLQHRGKCSNNV